LERIPLERDFFTAIGDGEVDFAEAAEADASLDGVAVSTAVVRCGR